jgi:rod shape determining protein RodA
MILAVYIAIMLFGLINLYSAAQGEAFFWAHTKRLAIAAICFALTARFLPVRHLNTYAFAIYSVTIFLLFVVFLVGDTAGGSQRWIRIGPLALQPSELAKVSVAIIVARFFYNNRLSSAYQLKDLWLLIVLVGIMFVLIFEQPDLGTAGICLIIAVAQVAFVRIDLRSFSIVLAVSVIVAGVGWNFLLHDYQKLRILNLINPNLDPHGSGYNSIQSLVAVGSGGLFGKGFLQGTQAQLQFLPARHTDFIFSVFAEEWGFLGCASVFLVFTLLAYLILEVARHAHDLFSALLAIGIGVLFYAGFVINVAMVMGIFPVVGIPLPFFSYGGSYLISMSVALGIVVAIDRQDIVARRYAESEIIWTGFSFKKPRRRS